MSADEPEKTFYEDRLRAERIEFWNKIEAGQTRMIKSLEILSSEETMEQMRTMIVQQAFISHELGKLNESMEGAGQKLEAAVVKLSSAFWNLMKVPVACMVVGVASWAFLYEQKISENTWLLMLGVAVFPWLGDSISAIARIFGVGRHGNGGTQK